MIIQEQYTPGYGTKLVQSFQNRSASKNAAFFVKHLQGNMKLLDCGCGPGTITVDFAEILTLGKIIGIDVEQSQIDIAQAHATVCKLTNVTFSLGNVYELKFPDDHFDAVFAHAVMQHLNNPLLALKEMYRVLKPGGIIGLRDDDLGSLVISPYFPLVEEFILLLEKVIQYNGGNHRVGRNFRSLLHQANFIRTEASATCEYDGISKTTQQRGQLASQAIQTFVGPTAIQLGWATHDKLKRMADACLEWGRHPDAFNAIIWCEAIGWKKKSN